MGKHETLLNSHMYFGPTPDGSQPEILWTENETNACRLHQFESYTPYTKDAFHRYRILLLFLFSLLFCFLLFSSSLLCKIGVFFKSVNDKSQVVYNTVNDRSPNTTPPCSTAVGTSLKERRMLSPQMNEALKWQVTMC